MQPMKTSAQYNIVRMSTNVEKLVIMVFNLNFWVAKEKQSGDFDPVTWFLYNSWVL